MPILGVPAVAYVPATPGIFASGQRESEKRSGKTQRTSPKIRKKAKFPVKREKKREKNKRRTHGAPGGFPARQRQAKTHVRAKKHAAPGGKGETVFGVFSGTKSGFGFVTPDEPIGDRDIFIPEGKCGSAVDGDRVRISYRILPSRDGSLRTEGRVLSVEEGVRTLFGTVVREREKIGRYRRTVTRLLPSNAKFPRSPEIEGGLPAEEGDLVEARLLRRAGEEPVCEVIRIFGNAAKREANYAAILEECGIVTDFSAEVLAEAERAASEPIDKTDRLDLTESIVFTIDGADAKDLDDAVSLSSAEDGGYLLGVHIADVSHYVGEKTPLDCAATARGTSVYFTDKVVPMLPPALSNGACSLNAGEEKYTLSALMHLSKKGDLLSVDIRESVIRSRVRGVYSEVNDLFARAKKSSYYEKYKDVYATLILMRRLYRLLEKKNEMRGAMTLDRPEPVILLGEDGMPTEIRIRERGDAERLIEAFMLMANEAVAEKMTASKIPCVYRVHAAPSTEKAEELTTFLHNIEFDTSYIRKDAVTSKALCRILKEAKERGISEAVSYVVLRSMAKAEYSAKPEGHFGLSLPLYCHFTSPIRRLSDLAVHRILHRVLFEGESAVKYASYATRAAAAATEGELRALAAERRIEDLYKVLYMQDKVGEEYDATVSSVTSFGIFAMLDNTIEGLIPLSTLPGVFVYDEKTVTLRSRDAVYRLGDRIRVRLEEADLLRGKLRFSDVAFTPDFCEVKR